MGGDKSKRALKPTAGGGGETSIHNLVPHVRRCALEDNNKEGFQNKTGECGPKSSGSE